MMVGERLDRGQLPGVRGAKMSLDEGTQRAAIIDGGYLDFRWLISSLRHTSVFVGSDALILNMKMSLPPGEQAGTHDVGLPQPQTSTKVCPVSNAGSNCGNGHVMSGW